MRTWTNTAVKHGTISGSTMHANLGEKACKECREAKNAYDLARGKTAYENLVRKLRSKARHRANVDLIAACPGMWTQLYNKHLDRVFNENADQLREAGETHDPS